MDCSTNQYQRQLESRLKCTRHDLSFRCVVSSLMHTRNVYRVFYLLPKKNLVLLMLTQELFAIFVASPIYKACCVKKLPKYMYIVCNQNILVNPPYCDQHQFGLYPTSCSQVFSKIRKNMRKKKQLEAQFPLCPYFQAYI